MITGALSIPFTAFADENGFKVYESVMVISADASATDSYAAQKLKHYLDKITGKSIEVVSDNSAASEYEICVGATNRITGDMNASADGSYIITSTTERIIISGAGTKGTINGGFLDNKIIVRTNSISVRAEVNSQLKA